MPGKDFLELLKWLFLHCHVFRADPWTLIDYGQWLIQTQVLAWLPNSEEKHKYPSTLMMMCSAKLGMVLWCTAACVASLCSPQPECQSCPPKSRIYTQQSTCNARTARVCACRGGAGGEARAWGSPPVCFVPVHPQPWAGHLQSVPASHGESPSFCVRDHLPSERWWGAARGLIPEDVCSLYCGSRKAWLSPELLARLGP